MKNKMAEYRLRFDPLAAHIMALIVDQENVPVACADIETTKRFNRFSSVWTHDVARISNRLKSSEIMDLDEFAAMDWSRHATFRNLDPRGCVTDAAYSWLLREIAPSYDEPSLEFTGTTFELFATGHRVGERPAVSGTASGRPRPRNSRRAQHFWI